MQIIGMGVPLYQEGLDMLMLALISTMGSRNTELKLERKKKRKIRQRLRVASTNVLENRRHISLWRSLVLENTGNILLKHVMHVSTKCM